MGGYGWRARRDRRRYRRAVRRAFATVTFYREQWAAAGHVLAEPVPTPTSSLPQPPHTLCPFARPWSPEREPSLWTPDLRALARVLRMAGCHENLPVLEVRDALLDHMRLPRLHCLRARPAYRVLLGQAAVVASDEHRTQLNREALAVAEAVGAGWVVGSPEELAAAPEAGALLRPVRRLPVAAVGDMAAVDPPVLVHEPMLGYLGALVPACGRLHLDWPRIHARERDGVVTFSLPRSRRPTLLEMVPPGSDRVTTDRCDRHRTPVLRPRAGPAAPA